MKSIELDFNVICKGCDDYIDFEIDRNSFNNTYDITIEHECEQK